MVISKTYIRYLIKRDIQDILYPDQPWTQEDFESFGKKRNAIGYVIEYDGEPVGFITYTLYKLHLEIANFGIHPLCRGKGLGRMLMTRIINKLCPERRTSIMMYVPDDKLDMHLFLRAMGFKAINVNDNDTYSFKYSIQPCSA